MKKVLIIMAIAGTISQLSSAATEAEIATVKTWIQAWLPEDSTGARRPAGITVISASNFTVLNKNGWGDAITLGSEKFDHGIYVDAPNTLRVTLPRAAKKFTATVGIDNNADTRTGAASGHGSVSFRVSAGGKELLKTEVMTLANSPKKIDVPLDGATEFELGVDPEGDRSYDQSVWGNAAVEFTDGTTMLLDSLGISRGMQPQIPFSFVYDGKPSSELLPKWKRTVADKKLDDNRTLRTVSYKDPATGLVCEVQAITFANHPAVDMVLRFRNEGDKDTPLLEQTQTLDVRFPAADAERVMVRRSLGSSAARTDFQPVDEELPGGKSISFAPAGGRSSNGILPFYKVQWSDGGVCVAIGWSGQWKTSIIRQLGAGVKVQAGMDLVRTVLHPGEEIRMPRVLLVHWKGDDYQYGGNLYRRIALEYYTPKIKGKPVLPIICHPSSYDELRNSNEKNQLEIIRATKKAGYEGYWLDAYWFEGYFPDGVGNWAIPIDQTIRKKDYPHGLAPLYEECEKLGLKFVLWFEPERVAAGTHIDVTYPQWVLRANNWGGGLFNLGDDEARKWMTDYLCRCIEAYHMDVLRIDFNIDPLPFWRANDAPDRQGMNEIRYMTGLYKMWDEILAKYPNIFIDNCASGGRRIDLETNMRSIPMWRSDYNDNNVVRGDTLADQGMTMGMAQFIPINTGPAWRADPYYWRCASSTGPEAYWDPRPDNYSIEQCKQAVAETQELREYVLGDFWQLTENNVDPRQWAAWQYHRPEKDDGYAVFFRRQDCPFVTMETSLRGVDADRKYRVRFYYDYTVAKEETLTGKQLQNFAVSIPKRMGSLLVRYEPAK